MSEVLLTVTEYLDGVAVEGESIVTITVTEGGGGAGGGGGVTDHGALTGLGDDDHTQYHTDARGDARYDSLGAASTAQAAAISAAATDATTKASAAQSAAIAASQPLDSDLTAIAGLDSSTAGALSTDGAGWVRKTYAQLKTALSLVKGDVGLGNVDNTADTAKPVSTAQQTALDLKANLASPDLTGNPTAPTQTAGNNSTRLATTAYVDTASGLAVPKSLYDANTILAATTDDTPAALTVAASRFVGRKATGDIAAMTAAEAAAVLGSGTRDSTTALFGDNTWKVPSGGSSVKDLRWYTPSGFTSIDEHNDDSLDGGWTRADAAGESSRAVWTELGDVLSVYNDGGDDSAEYHAILRALSGFGGSLSVGDAFVTCMSIWNVDLPLLSVGGLVLSDGTTHGSGNTVQAIHYLINTGSGANVDVRGGTGFNADGGASGSVISVTQNLWLWLRLVMTAANTWRVDTSLDGVSWRKGTGTVSKTITPTHVGYLSSSYGGASKFVASYECIRRVAGIS